MHYMRHNGQRRAIRGLDETQSEIMGSLAALGLDCHNELSLSITHCIKKKISGARAYMHFLSLSRDEFKNSGSKVCYFSGT